MKKAKYISIISNRKKVVLNVSMILYVIMTGGIRRYMFPTVKYMNRGCLSRSLSNNSERGFIKAHRGCIVSAMAIHDITDKINLSNGESLDFTKRKKNQIIEYLCSAQKSIISSFSENGILVTDDDYRRYFSSFDSMPFAFTDIQMVFNEESQAVDWIFRYGNPALAKLEKIPLERLIGSSFASLFSNMDSKWLKNYERTALYNETMEMIDFSPEIDTYLKVISFPTFKGHCGCILFNINEIEFSQNSSEAQQALELYLKNIVGFDNKCIL